MYPTSTLLSLTLQPHCNCLIEHAGVSHGAGEVHIFEAHVLTHDFIYARSLVMLYYFNNH